LHTAGDKESGFARTRFSPSTDLMFDSKSRSGIPQVPLTSSSPSPLLLDHVVAGVEGWTAKGRCAGWRLGGKESQEGGALRGAWGQPSGRSGGAGEERRIQAPLRSERWCAARERLWLGWPKPYLSYIFYLLDFR
jgi:hypothetical protein